MSYQKNKTNNSMWAGKTGVFLIAEIGGNHEGDFDYAKRLTQLAIDSGVDAVKFQIYTAQSLVNPKENPARFKHFKKFVLPRKKHIELAKMCLDNNVHYIASVWDVSALDWIDKYISIYKIGSGDMTAYPIIEKTLGKNKPTILATGMSTMKEVKASLAFISSVNPKLVEEGKIAVLQCTSAYPTPYIDANLMAIQSLKKALKIPVGYSDHTLGSLALEMAIGLGAEILEFHFTDTRRGKSFRDHKISLTYKEVRSLSKNIARIRDLVGDGRKKIMFSEALHRRTFRRAIYPSRNMEEGEIVIAEDFVFLRPNNGMDARDYKEIIGKRLLKNVNKYHKLTRNNFV